MMKLYLASTSPRRRQLLRTLGVKFSVLSPRYREKISGKETPAALVKKHAFGKALSVVSRVREGKVLSADSIVHCRGRILGKPRNKKDAILMMSLVQGKWQTVFTGVAILDVRKGRVVRKKLFTEKTLVRLKKLSREEILVYIRGTSPYDKAGGFEIQSPEHPLMEEIRGSFSNAVGLPVEKLRSLLLR